MVALENEENCMIFDLNKWCHSQLSYNVAVTSTDSLKSKGKEEHITWEKHNKFEPNKYEPCNVTETVYLSCAAVNHPCPHHEGMDDFCVISDR